MVATVNQNVVAKMGVRVIKKPVNVIVNPAGLVRCVLTDVPLVFGETTVHSRAIVIMALPAIMSLVNVNVNQGLLEIE